MARDTLRYDRMVEEALRGVVRQTLEAVVDHGPPGEHHFYITFLTEAPGVEIPEYMHARYPTEMTIVLQHQFWGLAVDEEAFSVTLSFDDVRERLKIPLAAITGFADPSVNFGLQFEGGLPAEAKQVRAGEPTGGSVPDIGPAGGATDAGDKPAAVEVANVVTLDTFRKK